MLSDKNDRFSFAKELIEKIVERLRPIDSVILSIAKETRDSILSEHSNSKIFGVFGKNEIFSTGTHSDKGIRLIQKIAKSLCKKYNAVVITGKCLYYVKIGKIKSESNTSTVIFKKAHSRDKTSTMMTFSRILGHIPDIGVFLIDDKRSASAHEEASFHTGERQYGLGVIVCNKNARHCKNSRKSEYRGLCFNECTHTDYKECLRPSSRCLTKKMNISKTTIEPFINKPSHDLVFIDDLKNIEKIVTYILKLKKQ